MISLSDAPEITSERISGAEILAVAVRGGPWVSFLLGTFKARDGIGRPRARALAWRC